MRVDFRWGFRGILNRGEQPYGDEHPLDEQRFLDSICFIYGHDPKKYDYLVRGEALPNERAEIMR